MTQKNISQEKQDKLITHLKDDYGKCDLSSSDINMLDYAAILTREPASICEDQITTLKKHGFSDLAIHDICIITAYFAFVNRIADGMGVELE